MPNSEVSGGNDSDRAPYTAVPSEREARVAERAGAREKEERSSRRFSTRVIGSSERDRMLKEARKIQFPIGLRGYERTAVDRYVERVNRLLAELEMSSSPESAVRHALDEVSEETRDILQRAHETADEITARSRAKADDRLQQAEGEAQEVREAAQRDASEAREAAQREAHELRELATGEVQSLRDIAQREAQEHRDVAQRDAQEHRDSAKRESTELRESTAQEMTELRETAVRETQQLRASAQREADELRGSARREADEMLENAETQTRELARSAEAIWRERRRLIEDMRTVGEQLVAIGEVEAKRFPRLAEEALLHVELGREQSATDAGAPAPGHEAADTSPLIPPEDPVHQSEPATPQV